MIWKWQRHRLVRKNDHSDRIRLTSDRGSFLFTIKEILDIAIKIEKNGEAVYRAAIEKISIPALIPVLEWMADEEVDHAKWFSDLKEKVAAGSEHLTVQEIPRQMLIDIVGEQSFSLDEIDFSKIDRVEDLIDIGIEFENDSILFYEMLQSFIQSQKTLSELQQIIAEEKRHIEKLQEFAVNTSIT